MLNHLGNLGDKELQTNKEMELDKGLYLDKGLEIQANKYKSKWSIRLIPTAVVFILTAVLTVACGNGQAGEAIAPSELESVGSNSNSNATLPDGTGGEGDMDKDGLSVGDDADENKPDMAAAADPNSIAVLVNKQQSLPENYEPDDLVYPDVRFTFKEKIEKRMMRSEAAKALEELFAAAEEDGIYLAGVSAYRSHSTQRALFNRYVERDGEEKARTYSAEPGHSEHETGLAIDVSGSDGKCAVEDCFADTKEAAWLAEHSAQYGFIIRYPKGKESITGYKYEPWHLRYVGKEIAMEIDERGITLEEYYDAVPVTSNP